MPSPETIRHFESSLDLFFHQSALTPSSDPVVAKSLGDLAMVLAHLLQFYPGKLGELPGQLPICWVLVEEICPVTHNVDSATSYQFWSLGSWYSHCFVRLGWLITSMGKTNINLSATQTNLLASMGKIVNNLGSSTGIERVLLHDDDLIGVVYLYKDELEIEGNLLRAGKSVNDTSIDFVNKTTEKIITQARYKVSGNI
ncbi:protein SDA1 [Carex littledalei]|uniref:Protein SDA1 n=1 Tax=Carex littledalei TaxID=544730 RepID=A0A833VVD3_9POAL|nr:protein SDA1 [Carex littledalei]